MFHVYGQFPISSIFLNTFALTDFCLIATPTPSHPLQHHGYLSLILSSYLMSMSGLHSHHTLIMSRRVLFVSILSFCKGELVF